MGRFVILELKTDFVQVENRLTFATVIAKRLDAKQKPKRTLPLRIFLVAVSSDY